VEVVEAAVEELAIVLLVLRGPVVVVAAAVVEPAVELHRQEELVARVLEVLHTLAVTVSQVHSLLSVLEVLDKVQRLLPERVDPVVTVVVEQSPVNQARQPIAQEEQAALLVLASAAIH